MELPPQTLIEQRFRIEETIARGGMGCVDRALDLQSGATVAIKSLLAAQPEHFGAIRREIGALMSIRHPNVVDIQAQGVHDGFPWYAMRYIAGRTLRDSNLFAQRGHPGVHGAARRAQRLFRLQHHREFGEVETADIDQRACAARRGDAHGMRKSVAGLPQGDHRIRRRQVEDRRKSSADARGRWQKKLRLLTFEPL